MRILFRVDGYPEIGMGHIVRCVAIAQHMKVKSPDIEFFFCGQYDEPAQKLLQKNKLKIYHKKDIENREYADFKNIVSQLKPNTIFIDRLYEYDREFVIDLKKYSTVIMFHNLCEGALYSQIAILPSAHSSDEVVEKLQKQSKNEQLLIGAPYIPINGQIRNEKSTKKQKTSNRRTQIILTTGGSDPKGVSLKVLNWLKDEKFSHCEIIFLKGNSYMRIEELDALAKKLPENIKVEPFSYSWFNTADIAICTFGVTTYELLYFGVPTLSIGHALTNARGSQTLADRHGAIVDLGYVDDLTKEMFVNDLNELIISPDKQNKLRTKGQALIDGKGIDRIVNTILETTQP
ncbi:MAG: hypothetical protein PF489_13075 [Salinivirgaceae bacterium]|jgi:UDP-2,4-diacetamido-2,4,6-trideoxy-beta-L-altropyranose hydrolase|nr:hypothetical protein [Salinivirgaceae bacterium]